MAMSFSRESILVYQVYVTKLGLTVWPKKQSMEK